MEHDCRSVLIVAIEGLGVPESRCTHAFARNEEYRGAGREENRALSVHVREVGPSGGLSNRARILALTVPDLGLEQRVVGRGTCLFRRLPHLYERAGDGLT